MTLPSYGQPIVRVDLAELIAAISGSGSFVTSVTGTPNQVTAAPTTGAVVVGLPSSGSLPGTWHAVTGFVVDAGGLTVTAGGATVTAGNVAITAGNLTFAAASAKIIPGATSLLFRNNADSADNVSITDAGLVTVRAGIVVTAGGITVTAGNVAITAGNLTFAAASAKVIPGATSLLFRNNADGATNLGITDAGVVTVRAGLTITAGQLLLPDGTLALPAMSFASTPTVGFNLRLAAMTFVAGGQERVGYGTTGFVINSDMYYGFSSSATDPLATADVRVFRDAASILALRNGTNAQGFYVYNTYSGGGTNYERGVVRWGANIFDIGIEAGGSGSTTRLTRISHGSGSFLDVVTNFGSAIGFVRAGQVGVHASAYASIPAINGGEMYAQKGLKINVAAFGTSGEGVLAIGNFTEPTTSPADMIQLYSVDLAGAGTAGVGLRTEVAVVTEAVGASDRTLQVKINGTVYKFMLHT